MQLAAGAETRLLTPDEIKAEYPFYMVDDLDLGSINTKDEGYFDGSTVFDWFRRKAREAGVEYVADEVVGMTLSPNGDRIQSVTLASGRAVGCGTVVNASRSAGGADGRDGGDRPADRAAQTLHLGHPGGTSAVPRACR